MKQRSFRSGWLVAGLVLAMVLMVVAAWPSMAAPPTQQPPTPDLMFETDEIPEGLSSVERSQFILLRDAERATANLLLALEAIPEVAEEEFPTVGEVTTPGAETTPGGLETPAAETTPGVLETPAAETTPGVLETPAAEATPGALGTPETATAPGEPGAATGVTPAPTTAADTAIDVEATTLDIDDATNILLGVTHDLLATAANGLDDLDRIAQREAFVPAPAAAPGTPAGGPGVVTTPGVLETPGAETTPGAITTPGAPGVAADTPVPGAPAPETAPEVAVQATRCGDLAGVVRAAQGDVGRIQGRVGFFGRLSAGPEPVEQRLAISDLRTHHRQMQEALRCLATAPQAVPVTGEEEILPTPGEEGRAAPTGTVTLTDITDNPERFFGQTVTVEGVVNVIQSPNAFTIAEDAPLDTAEILVLHDRPLTRDLNEAEPVRVTGTVREFARTEIERDLGLDLDEQLVEDFESKPVIVAQSVRALGEAPVAEPGVTEPDVTTPTAEASPGARETPTAEASPGARETPTAEATPGARETPGVTEPDVTEPDVTEPDVTEPGAELSLTDITSNPERFFGRTVTVTGNVDVALSPNAFTIAENNLLDLGEITILSPTPRRALNEGETLRVRGTVRQFVRGEIERDLDFDLEEDLAVQFEGKPVIVADSIIPVVEQ